MAKHKIGWCSMTWNSVWGCRNNCEYCYARKIAKRFAIPMSNREIAFTGRVVFRGTEDISLEKIRNFEPFFLESQFHKKFPKKPQRIFVGSMSEIYYWEKEWIEMVIEKVKQYPQHTFQFLTKDPEVYNEWVFPENCWLGVTVTKKDDIKKDSLDHLNDSHLFKKTFISFEPLLEEINPNDYIGFWDIDWVIIGAETGNRKGKIIPKKEWVENIVNYCKEASIPVYLKYSLKEIYPVEIKEFPEVK